MGLTSKEIGAFKMAVNTLEQLDLADELLQYFTGNPTFSEHVTPVIRHKLERYYGMRMRKEERETSGEEG